jgi:uncharacterized protein
MIPSYPSFGPLEKSDQPAFEAAFSGNPPEISEFTFSNLYAWRNAYRFRVALRDGFILLQAKGSKEGSPAVFFPPIGKGNPNVMMLAILNEIGGSFVRLP